MISHQTEFDDFTDADLPLSSPLVAIEEQHILHHTPCTWDEFLQLDPPPSGYYDYVDGVIVWCPNMANADHNGLANWHAIALTCCQRRVYVHSTPSVQVLADSNTLEWTLDHESHSSDDADASSPAEQAPSQFDLRHPDLAIVEVRRDSDGSSTTSRDPARTGRVQYTHPYVRSLFALVEITSDSTRDVDLVAKWRAYARSGVPLYIILDRGTTTKTQRIIVGSLEKHWEDTEKSVSGDRQRRPRDIRTTRRTSSPATYYRKVYMPEDTVDCPFFSQLGMTTADLLDVGKMKSLAARMDNDRAQQRQRAERAEQERDEEREQKKEERKRADRAERERDEEREQKKEERKRADRAERERKALEERLKRGEQALKAVEERLKRAERERDEERRQRKASKERDQETEAARAREGGRREPEARDKKAQAARKSSAIKGSSASGSSPTTSPEHKKSRRKSY